MGYVRDLVVVFEAKVSPPKCMLEREDPAGWLRAIMVDEALEALDESPSIMVPTNDHQGVALSGPKRGALMHAGESLEVLMEPRQTVLRFRYLNITAATALGLVPLKPAARDTVLIQDVVEPFKQALWRNGSNDPNKYNQHPINEAERRYLLLLEQALANSLKVGQTPTERHGLLYYTNLEGSVYH